MISFLSSWAEQVILAVIIATILELILPNSKNKKYVQMVIGVYVLFNIISPIIKNKEKLEITIEVNPGTVTKEKLQMFKNCGINRLSIGLQSTNDELLKQLGRIHNYNQFLDTYNWAKEVGFENINVDLMLGIPNQKIEDLKDSLEDVINCSQNFKNINVQFDFKV